MPACKAKACAHTWAAEGLQASGAEEVARGSPHAPVRLRNQEAHYPPHLLRIAREAPVEFAVLGDHLPASMRGLTQEAL